MNVASLTWFQFLSQYPLLLGLSGDSVVKTLPSQCRRHGFNPWVGKIPWRRRWQPTLVFLPGKSHRQRSLMGYSPWGHKESDTTEQLHNNTKWYNQILKSTRLISGEQTTLLQTPLYFIIIYYIQQWVLYGLCSEKSIILRARSMWNCSAKNNEEKITIRWS